METLITDVRYGLRFLWQKPTLTLAALVTLALGIGASTAIFSVVNAVLLRPLPYAEPDELVMVWQDHTRIDGPATEWASPDNFLDWRAQNDVFEGMFALSGWSPTLTGVQEPEQLNGAAVSYDAFSLLGTKPLLGRDFRPEEDQPKAARVVLLSHALWQRRFGSSPDVVGTSIRFENETATVIGVMPPELDFPVLQKPEIFTPLAIDPADDCGRGCVTLRVIGRLKPGVRLARARADMDAVVRTGRNAAWREEPRTYGRHGQIFRSELIVSAGSFALGLLTGASLLIWSFHALLRVELGFDAKNVTHRRREHLSPDACHRVIRERTRDRLVRDCNRHLVTERG